jgi:hypothetical protein
MAKVVKQKMYKVKVTQIITVHKSFKAWKPEQALEMAKDDYWDMPPMKAKYLVTHMPMNAEVEEK